MRITTSQHSLSLLLIAILTSASPSARAAKTYQITPILPPGAISALATGVNNAGQVVGDYNDANGVGHGFLKSGDTYSTIDSPGAINTQANGINNVGQVVGIYTDANFVGHGFVKTGNTYKSFDIPGAVFTFPSKINNAGQV